MAVPGAEGTGVEVRRAAVEPPAPAEMEATLRAEGLTPHAWGNGPGATYGWHAHEDHTVLYCVAGAIVFHTDEGDVALGPGDRMELPARTGHAATVGVAGVRCVEAYRPDRIGATGVGDVHPVAGEG